MRGVIGILLWFSAVQGFDQLDPKYQIRYGDPSAPTKVVEYFSFSCPLCIDLVNQEFPEIRRAYLDRLSYIFHPNPVDLTTLQAMICLKQLSEEEKRFFLEGLCIALANGNEAVAAMRELMEALHHSVPDLASFEFLKQEETFADALRFIRQENAVILMPQIEINEVRYEDIPTASFLKGKLS
jgi:hypothetical protein